MYVKKPSVLIILSVVILATVALISVVESKLFEDEASVLEEQNNKDEGSDFAYRVLQAIEKRTESKSVGSIYYRWGSTKCGADSELIYEGYVGGGYYRHTGTGVNALCLPTDPELENTSPFKIGMYNLIFGAEYEMGPKYAYYVRCAVCSTSIRMRNLMIPAKLSCPLDWTKEYSGWLSSGYYEHAAASEFVCFDGGLAAEVRRPGIQLGGTGIYDGKLFYHVKIFCGSLPCNVYDNGTVVPCVVCSN